MSGTAELIYKTSSPAALAWISDFSLRDQAARDVAMAFKARINEAIPPWPGESTRELVTLRDHIVGVSYSYEEGRSRHWGDKINLPTGWRVKREWDRVLVPNKSTKEGKAWQAEMDALPWLDILKDMHEHLGTPSVLMTDGRMFTPGTSVDRDEDGNVTTIYSTWGSGRCADEFFKEIERAKKDADVTWEEVPRSQWYARLEALDAKKENA